MKANEMVSVNGEKAILINYNSNKAVVRFISTGITTEVALDKVFVN